MEGYVCQLAAKQRLYVSAQEWPPGSYHKGQDTEIVRSIQAWLDAFWPKMAARDWTCSVLKRHLTGQSQHALFNPRPEEDDAFSETGFRMPPGCMMGYIDGVPVTKRCPDCEEVQFQWLVQCAFPEGYVLEQRH